MSYDLFFRTEARRPTLAELRSWFSGRPHYRLHPSGAAYNNDATGASFVFELQDDGRDGVAPVSFALPLPRPSTFALEAEPEVAALAQAFGLRVFDPQGVGEGPYDRDTFLRGWRAANLAALRASGGGPRRTLPSATSTAVWTWNRAREAYLDRLGSVEGSPCFVPQVQLLAPESDRRVVLSAVVWAGAMPLALPEVDLVLVTGIPGDGSRSREHLPRAIPLVALRPWLEDLPRRDADHRFGLRGAVHPTGLQHHLVDVDPADPARRGLFDALRTLGTERRLQRLDPAEVLDRETVDQARDAQRVTSRGLPRFG